MLYLLRCFAASLHLRSYAYKPSRVNSSWCVPISTS
uniref:Uncharacterized protein n=1 Tax=Rhizophora mucronata TaxID=61149 RepID=A0A2P2QRB1_RHIMU